MDWPIAVGLVSYQGYDFDQVFKNLHGIGAEYVEIDYIKTPLGVVNEYGLTHLNEEDLQKSMYFLQLLNQYHLKALTFSGHVKLINEEEVELFLKKMEFAKKIGAKYITTGESPMESKNEFFKHIRRVEKKARELDLVVCLETEMSNTLITRGTEGIPIINEIASPYIKMTYDTGNIYYAQKGKIDIAADLQNAIDYIETIHFKDPYFIDGVLRFGEIGKGEINFFELAEIIKTKGRIIPVTIEIPYFFQSNQWGPFEVSKKIFPIDEINRLLIHSICFIQDLLKD
ncbi:MAG: sugar phosphate isomerase/epimerase [Candidatus Atribacteria bacterium]|nr:sugar phosphate isomerase/epimerase [Candidatus Atribacteria bacterium]